MLYRTLSAPITCQIELTSSCNNNCIYCYNHWRHDQNSNVKSFTKEQLDIVIEQVIENDIFEVTFTGGEVLLKKDILFYGLKKLIDNNISCTINSNLTRLTKDDGKILYDLGIRNILTSLCSYNQETHDYITKRIGSFRETLTGIKNAQESGINIACSMVVIDVNVSHVIDTGLFLKKHGVNVFFVTKASPPVNDIDFKKHLISKNELLNTLTELKMLQDDHQIEVGILECYPLCFYKDTLKFNFATSRNCSAGITTCTIGADGAIRPCSHSDEIYGNIFHAGLKKAWISMENCRNGSLLPTVCRKCKYLNRCSGGCRVDAKYSHGHYASVDPFADDENINAIYIEDFQEKQIGETEILAVNQDIKTRKESFGILVASKQRLGTPSLLTFETYNLLSMIKDRIINIKNISEEFNIPLNTSSQLCALLVKDNILQQVEV